MSETIKKIKKLENNLYHLHSMSSHLGIMVSNILLIIRENEIDLDVKNHINEIYLNYCNEGLLVNPIMLLYDRFFPLSIKTNLLLLDYLNAITHPLLEEQYSVIQYSEIIELINRIKRKFKTFKRKNNYMLFLLNVILHINVSIILLYLFNINVDIYMNQNFDPFNNSFNLIEFITSILRSNFRISFQIKHFIYLSLFLYESLL